jgi:hypothetical protein
LVKHLNIFRNWAAFVLVVGLGLSGCAMTPEPTLTETVTENADVQPEPKPAEIKPVAADFLAMELSDYSIDEDGGWLISGYLQVRYEITNTSDQPVYGIATTLRVIDNSGEMLFISNLNQEVEIQPGKSISFGLFGDGQQPLIKTVPQWKTLLEMDSLSEGTEVSLEVRKVLLSNDEIIEFVSEIPSEELKNENN